ncbi:MAG TPA: flagellar biosynthetic protein FliO [Acidobacteriaceae bacterium]|nr:flagellar biosynthetic protein FliO [Acidobacteriaceae bacterium]
MWRTANGLVGVPGPMSHPASDAMWNPADAGARESARSKPDWRRWIPTLERTPPLMQFIVRLARWVKTKYHSGVIQTPPQLRLVGQLALGAKRHLSLVEVGGVQFLVGGGAEHITVIVPISSPHLCQTENLQDAGKPQQL